MKIFFIVLAAAVLSAVLLWREKPCANFTEATLQTPTQKITVALAQTPQQQAKGLGGCKSVPKNSGMYFPFGSPQELTFWMKDMVIPIDIIWIKEGKVIGIEQHVPNVPLTTPDGELSRYTSPELADAVLEVGAGMAEQYDITEGVSLSLTESTTGI